MNLTAREREVAQHLTTGASNAEIASALGIAMTTVKAHVCKAMNKTGARNRTELAIMAIRAPFVTAGGER